jgi:hypothetical protein
MSPLVSNMNIKFSVSLKLCWKELQFVRNFFGTSSLCIIKKHQKSDTKLAFFSHIYNKQIG